MSDLEAVDRLFVRLGSLHRRLGSATLAAALEAAGEAVSAVEDVALRRLGLGGLPRSGTVVALPKAARRGRQRKRLSGKPSACTPPAGEPAG